ncbi:MAG: winged helix-turn-helix transcriptional regulator [Actinomycetota bacterium]
MPKRSYGQFEGLATALDAVGERWTLLVVRELLLGPRRYKDLLEGLPGIGTNLLATRLKALQAEALVDRRVLPAPAGSTVYELTERGRSLEPALVALAQWGLAGMEEPKPTDVLCPGWGVLAFKAVFRPEAAAGVHETFQFDIAGDVFHLRVDDGMLVGTQGPAPAPDLVFETDLPTLLAIGGRQLSPADAVVTGRATMTGTARAAARIVELFGFPGRPESGAGLEPGWGPGAMRATFRADAAKGVHETYEMHIDEEVFHMVVDDGEMSADSGPSAAPDFVLTTDTFTFMAIGAGQISPMDALVSGRAEMQGDADAAMRCLAIFGYNPDLAGANL